MIAAHMLKIGGVYEIENDYPRESGNLLLLLSRDNDGPWLRFRFLYLTGNDLGKTASGGLVSRDTSFSFKEIS